MIMSHGSGFKVASNNGAKAVQPLMRNGRTPHIAASGRRESDMAFNSNNDKLKLPQISSQSQLE